MLRSESATLRAYWGNLRVLEVTEIKTVPLGAFISSVCGGSSGPYAGNAWTTRYSGPRPTWRGNYSDSKIIITSLERTPDAKGTRR